GIRDKLVTGVQTCALPICQGQTNLGLFNLAAIACGGSHNLALKTDGALIASGYNFYGQCAVPLSATNPVLFAAGGNHSLALVSRSEERRVGKECRSRWSRN